MSKVTDIQWLESIAKKLIKKHWDIDEIPNIVLDRKSDEEWVNYKVDGNPFNLGGLYYSSDKTIEFNSNKNIEMGESRVKKVLLHELCHWYLHINELPYRDYDVRFASELIRVGAVVNKNVLSHLEAYKKALKVKRNQVFEIIENSESHLVSRITHKRKDENDFKRDLKSTVLRMQSEFDESEGSYIGEIVENVCKWYGYKYLPSADYSIMLGNSYGSLNDDEEFEDVLDDIESELRWIR